MRTLSAILGVALVVTAFQFAGADSKSKKNMEPKDKTVTTPSGLKYIDVVVGTGATPVTGQSVTVDYTGTFQDGKAFDSNVDPKFGHVQPFTFKIGTHQVI